MTVSQTQLTHAIEQARVRESMGYFELVRAGDQRAASLFARLIAYDLNPTGRTTDYGWLSKSPGESQVDGWAEDAICGNANAADLENVVDLINGAGAPGASIGGSVKQRRENNKWVKPKALSQDEMDYLRSGGVPDHPPDQPPAPPVGFPYPDEPTAVLAYEKRVAKAYQAVGRKFPDEADPDAFRHFARYGYSCSKMPEPEAANKHIKELRTELGAPPE